jgi:hypothetical protein
VKTIPQHRLQGVQCKRQTGADLFLRKSGQRFDQTGNGNPFLDGALFVGLALDLEEAEMRVFVGAAADLVAVAFAVVVAAIKREIAR